MCDIIGIACDLTLNTYNLTGNIIFDYYFSIISTMALVGIAVAIPLAITNRS